MTKPGSVCHRPVDFMTIYPALTDLCALQTPKHVESSSVRSLLVNPQAPWTQPAITTYRYKNHAVRIEGRRHIRYENGDKEPYNKVADPNERKKLARAPAHAAKKAALAKLLPTRDHADLGGTRGAGGANFSDKATQQRARQKQAVRLTP